jgi:uncharacterized membrane protein
MTFIGGLAGILIGLLDRHPSSQRLRMWQQCILGMLIVLDIEFISGLIFNMRLNMNMWNYSGYAYNLDGQICARFAVIWFFIIPAVAWMDDLLRWKLFSEPRPKSILHNYKRLFTLN